MTQIIYRLTSNIEGDNRFYIGSTNDIKRRMRQHKNKPAKDRRKWFQEVGFSNIKYEILKEITTKITKAELEKEEDIFITEYLNKDGNCMNSRRAVNKKISRNTGRNSTRYYNFWRCDLNGKKIQQYKDTKEAAEWVKKEELNGAIITSIMLNVTMVLSGDRKKAYKWMWRPDTDDLLDEIWNEIPKIHTGNIEGIFASSKGRIKRDNKITYGCKTDRYMQYMINCIAYGVHVLIALAFLTNPDNLPVVDHKDNNPSNNCLENLRYVTNAQNSKYAIEMRLNKGSSKRISQFDLNNNFIKNYDSTAQAGRALSKDSSGISRAIKNGTICANFRWKFA